MLVRMKTKIGGYRDGLEWPDAGDTIDVPDHEATSLILNRYAEAMEAPDADQDSQPHADSDDQPDRGQADDPAADSDGQPDDNSNGGADEPTEATEVEVDNSIAEAAGDFDELADGLKAKPAAKTKKA